MDLVAVPQGAMVMGAIEMRTDFYWLVSSSQGSSPNPRYLYTLTKFPGQ